MHKLLNYHHNKSLKYALNRKLHAKISMIHTKSCKIGLQPLLSNFVSVRQISRKYSLLHVGII